MLMSIRRLVVATAKRVGSLALGGAILWQVIQHSDPPLGIAYVHVSKMMVDVTIDDQAYWVETYEDSPIVCELSPGRHVLRMFQSGHVLYEEEFTLDLGQEVVLTAWDKASEQQDESRPSITPLSPSSSPLKLARRSP
jgi:hypothetical protein